MLCGEALALVERMAMAYARRMGYRGPAGRRELPGVFATRDEMSYPDWRHRLRQARQEAKQGKGLSLDDYLQRRAVAALRR